jgi:hypothetical protein
MVLKDVFLRRGIAFLEPACVTLKGHQTEDREALQEADFARGLRHKLGYVCYYYSAASLFIGTLLDVQNPNHRPHHNFRKLWHNLRRILRPK